MKTADPRSPGLEGDLKGLSANAPELRQRLLAWWELHGRHAIPWKLLPDGSRPADGEAIDPYGVFVAEVTRAARLHSRSMLKGIRRASGPERA